MGSYNACVNGQIINAFKIIDQAINASVIISVNNEHDVDNKDVN